MKWIKCSEKMPEENKPVLICMRNDSEMRVSYLSYPVKGDTSRAYIPDNIWYNEVNCCGIEEFFTADLVTHWMELPEKPEVQYKRLLEIEDKKSKGDTIECYECRRPPCNYCN